MNTAKWTLAILLAACTAISVTAQSVNKEKLGKQIDRAALRAKQSSKTCTCKNCEDTCACNELTASEQIAAETELQHIRDTRDDNATFDKYPYLLDPAYRRRNDNLPCQCILPDTISVQSKQDTIPQSPALIIQKTGAVSTFPAEVKSVKNRPASKSRQHSGTIKTGIKKANPIKK